MGDWCKLPNGAAMSPNLDPDSSFGSECPLGSVLSGHSSYSKWETGIKGNTDTVRRFKCTECEKGTYKDVTGRYDGLIVNPGGRSNPLKICATDSSDQHATGRADSKGDSKGVKYCTDKTHPARTNCTACPAGKTTAGKGSNKATDCKGPPPAGSDEAAYWAPEEKTSPGGKTEGYWQQKGYSPANIAYIMAFGITALLATGVVAAEKPDYFPFRRAVGSCMLALHVSRSTNTGRVVQLQ